MTTKKTSAAEPAEEAAVSVDPTRLYEVTLKKSFEFAGKVFKEGRSITLRGDVVILMGDAVDHVLEV